MHFYYYLMTDNLPTFYKGNKTFWESLCSVIPVNLFNKNVHYSCLNDMTNNKKKCLNFFLNTKKKNFFKLAHHQQQKETLHNVCRVSSMYLCVSDTVPMQRILKQKPWQMDLLTSWSGRLSKPTWPARDKDRTPLSCGINLTGKAGL